MLQEIKRPGMDKLLDFIRKSDFYEAPASSRFHLATKGGLLQHSLNVYDALVGRMEPFELSDGEKIFRSRVAGKVMAEFPQDAATISALLHDLCKTHFYKVDYRNQKIYKPGGSKRDAGGAYDWERVPLYTIDDHNPYGHGEKSVMMASEFIRLTMEERYAIRWHMGMADCSYNDVRNFNASAEKYPLVLFLHNADQEASHFMEGQDGNLDIYQDADEDPQENNYDAAAFVDQSPFEEAPKI